MMLKMLLFMVLLTLELHTCLSELDRPYPDKPCTEAVNQNAYDTFLHRHLRKDTPADPNKVKEWQKFVNKIKTWDRKTQSFFPFSEASRVIAVCSTGGKQLGDQNFCISNEPLVFFTVEVNDKKQVKKVIIEEKHVILSCDKIRSENKCLPVHFQANSNNTIPNNNAPNCS